eukprot:364170-Chlamydomonas_euryale.AAC.13
MQRGHVAWPGSRARSRDQCQSHGTCALTWTVLPRRQCKQPSARTRTIFPGPRPGPAAVTAGCRGRSHRGPVCGGTER